EAAETTTGAGRMALAYVFVPLGFTPHGGTSETLLNSADIHHELLMEEIELIKSIGIDALKLIGFAIGLLMGGGVILQIMDIATRVNV
ncbi:hypothetical protein AAEI02_22845, partial [Shewanella xiamenensis]